MRRCGPAGTPGGAVTILVPVLSWCRLSCFWSSDRTAKFPTHTFTTSAGGTEVSPMTTWSDVLRRAHLVSCSLHLECALPRATLPHAFELCRSSKRAMLLLLFLWLGSSRPSLQPHLQLRLLQHFTVA